MLKNLCHLQLKSRLFVNGKWLIVNCLLFIVCCLLFVECLCECCFKFFRCKFLFIKLFIPGSCIYNNGGWYGPCPLPVNHIAEVAGQQNKKVIITSFNGDYAGYITEDEHYESIAKEEVMALNWVGPYYGSYFAEMINTLLKK